MAITAQSPPTKPTTGRQPALMLGMATLGFGLTFWAWALLSPLGTHFKTTLHLTSFLQALLVAVPVLVGSLGRIPVGALTDRYGGRVMFPIICFATIVPVLFIGQFGYRSYGALLVGGFFLGIGGTTFAVGVPFVSAWFPPQRRGMAIGIFGAGMGGTAISALTTVKLLNAHGIRAPFVLTAVVLAAFGTVAAVVLRDSPNRVPPTQPLVRRLMAAARLPVTWQLAALYAVAFGGYVAFSVYLPTYLKNAYGLSQADAANRMAGFVLLAVIARPLGGWLSDRVDPTRVLAAAFAVVTMCAIVQSGTPSLVPTATIAFLAMASALGAASGAVFALVALRAPADMVGTVTGVVGAAGGLGGFVPPLVMGSVYSHNDHNYAGGLIALAVVAAACCLFTLVRRGTPVRPAHAAPGR